MDEKRIDTSQYSAGCQSIENFFPKESERIDYKTLRDVIKMLKRQNKILAGKNTKVTFTVTLPMPK